MIRCILPTDVLFFVGHRVQPQEDVARVDRGVGRRLQLGNPPHLRQIRVRIPVSWLVNVFTGSTSPGNISVRIPVSWLVNVVTGSTIYQKPFQSGFL